MLTRWDPFQEMLNLRDTVDRLFDTTMGLRGSAQGPMSWGLALDVAEDNDEFIVKASIPGIDPDDLDITFTENTLTIKGEIKQDREVEEARYHLRERRYGSFSRSITLGSKVKSEDIKATYESGVLTLRLPKAEEVKPKRIAIKATSPKVIEGKVKDKK